MAIIFAGTNGYLDTIAVSEVRAFEIELYKYIETRHPDLFTSIAQKKVLDDEIKGKLNAAVKAFAGDFTARKSAAA